MRIRDTVTRDSSPVSFTYYSRVPNSWNYSLSQYYRKKLTQIQDDSQKQGLLSSKAILKGSRYFLTVFKLCAI